jgi:predicted protein tyrosine phosphatase
MFDLGSIEAFDRSNLRPTNTRVTYLTSVQGNIDNRLFRVPPFENVFISSVDGAHNWEEIEKHAITHVLCVAPDLEHKFKDKKIIYHQLDILDTVDEDLTKFMKPCMEFIETARNSDGKVLIHCQAGISRSASVCILYMMWKNGLDYDQAYEELKKNRVVVRPNKGFVVHLRNLHNDKFSFMN